MNERELSLIKVLGEEFSLILSDMRESFHKELELQRQVFEEKLSLLSKTIDEIKDSSSLDLNSLLTCGRCCGLCAARSQALSVIFQRPT